MLLFPRNPCEKLCQKLRFNVDDTEPTKYFMCGSCRGDGKEDWVSTFAGSNCSCGKLMDQEMKLEEGEEDNSRGNGVFVTGETTYLIFDDLRVLHNSPGNTVHQLVQLGYTDFTKLAQVSPDVALPQIMELLKRALISKSPLTDVFLAREDGGSNPTSSFTPRLPPENVYWSNRSINLKITISKSKNKILYAEAEAQFADFLFSFFTIPLGSILKLLACNVTVGSMHNLYRSLNGLISWFPNYIIYHGTWSPLLNLNVAPQYGCKTQPLELREEETPDYWYGTGVYRNKICYVNKNGVIAKSSSQVQNPKAMKLFDPRSADGRRESARGFVRRLALCAVMDDLQVTPLTSASSISFLQKLNVPLNDLEEHAVRIDRTEALNLLGASLTSKAALTNGLFYLVKKPKDEATT